MPNITHTVGGEFKTLSDLKRLVEAEGGVLTITMGNLRDAHGAGRLGEHVRTNISRSLLGVGLGHYPKELPSYQHEDVRVYSINSPAGELIDAVLNPGLSNDEKVRQTVGQDAAKIINKIRDLVCP